MRIRSPIAAFACVIIASCGTPALSGDTQPRFARDTTPGVYADGDRLEVVFPTVPIERLGCPADSGRRLYYWMASADYPDRRYSNNHFQQVRAWFKLPQFIEVGSAPFDSAIARQEVVVDEARGEPPMTINVVPVDGARLIAERVDGGRELRARIIVQGKRATQSMAATADSLVMLGWCDSSTPYQHIIAPFRR